MKLQSKVAIIIGSAWLAICAIVYIDSRWIVVANYKELEHTAAQMEVRDVQRAYDHAAQTLQIYSTAWAVWDEAYEFIQRVHPEFIAANFIPGTFTSSHINFFMFYSGEGKLLHGMYYDLVNNKVSPLPASLTNYLDDNKHFLKHPDAKSKKLGILNTKDGLVLMSALPVLTGDNKGPPHGSLLMGYYLNDSYFNDLADTVGLRLVFYPIQTVVQNEKLNTALVKLQHNPSDNIVKDSKQTAYGYILLKDIAGSPAGLIQIEIPRTIFLEGLATARHYFFIVVTLGFFVVLLTGYMLKKFVLDRLLNISRQVQHISRTNKFHKKIKFSGNDELSSMIVSINSMMQLINNSQEQLKHLATHDSLTELPNRELFYELLSNAMHEVARTGSKLAVFFLDMDTFKQVNDQYGHYVGDRLLQFIAERLKNSLRKSDVVARQSGDEFILFINPVQSLEQAELFAKNILTIGDQPFVVNDINISAKFSVGISIYSGDQITIDELMRQADAAMYEAKKSAGNSYQVYQRSGIIAQG